MPNIYLSLRQNLLESLWQRLLPQGYCLQDHQRDPGWNLDILMRQWFGPPKSDSLAEQNWNGLIYEPSWRGRPSSTRPLLLREDFLPARRSGQPRPDRSAWHWRELHRTRPGQPQDGFIGYWASSSWSHLPESRAELTIYRRLDVRWAMKGWESHIWFLIELALPPSLQPDREGFESSYLGEWSIVTNSFQMGWNHHQLGIPFQDASPSSLARSPSPSHRRHRQGLRDSNWQVRLAAAEAMAQLGEVKEGLNTAVGKGFLLVCVF